MSKLLRHFAEGQVCFVTSVTHQRRNILTDTFSLFREAVASTRERIRFDLIAWVVLPDHFHMLIDPQDENTSDILKRLKLAFAYRYRSSHELYRGKIWQRRFWDHIIRDQTDLNRHIDYIHYNPVKHGLGSDPFEWPYSSLERFYKNGFYQRDWGTKSELQLDGEFGE